MAAHLKNLATLKSKIPGVALISVPVALAFLINKVQPAVSPLALCVAFGFAIANFWQWPEWANSGSQFASKRVLRLGVVLLGAQVSIESIEAIGIQGLLIVIFVVSITILGIFLLSRIFNVSSELGLLIGVGFGVCGATAVAAVRPQTRATEEETSYAIALISLCGTLSIVVLPFLGDLMNLSDSTFGAWTGAAVHDIGQVIATASMRSSNAVSAAIVIKLARVCLLAPIVVALAIRHRRYLMSQKNSAQIHSKVPWIPLFVIGFIAVAVVHNIFTIAPNINQSVVTLSKVLIGSGLVALGSNVRWKSIRAIGMKPMAMGMCAWVIVAGVSLLAVQISGI